MKCPICGRTLPQNTDRCPDCGFHCRTAAAATATAQNPTRYTPPNPTKKTRGCFCALALIIPLLLGLIAAIVGLTAYLLEDIDFEEFGYEFYEDAPFENYGPADPPDAADDYCFTIRNGAVTFLPHKWEGGRVLRIPETVDGETVTALAPGCFRDCTRLTTIVLPETVTSIGREAFSGCSELLGLYLHEGMESIGPRAFEGCISMESVYIPGSVTEIAPGCFDDCAALLYIFYEGEFEDWDELYADFINPFTTAICHDGDYYHGAGG